MQERKRAKGKQPGPTKTPDQNTDRTETPPREPNTDLVHNPARRRRKKKTGAGGDLGVGDDHEVRVEVRERGHENTRGNPNQKGLGFPSA